MTISYKIKMKIKKVIAPCIITVFLIIYFGVYIWILGQVPLPMWAKILGIGVPLVLIGTSIYVLVERIKEIRSGEEDDLSKY
jgi:hypothetical protein